MKPSKNRTIILPIGTKEYHQIIDSKILYRKKIDALIEQYPEIFPSNIMDGYSFLGYSKNTLKLPISRRVIRLKKSINSYEDFLLHPCFVLPYLKAVTKKVSDGLALRKYNVPYHAIATRDGRNAMFWYRLELALSQYNIVGTTIKKKNYLPFNLLMDEHHTKLLKNKIYVCTTVGDHCFLGAAVSENLQYLDLKKAYSVFKKEVQKIYPNYCPISINMDGYKSSRKAVKELFAPAGLLRCFLHSFLKIRNCGTKAYDLYFDEVARLVWRCYYAENKRAFAQRISHLKHWTLLTIPDSPFKASILNLCKKKQEFMLLYDYQNGRKTSNMLDRLMKYQDRRLYATQNFHGNVSSANAAVRAHALLINFCPYSSQTIDNKGGINSPFEQINGFVYRKNWLENLLVAASLNGNKIYL